MSLGKYTRPVGMGENYKLKQKCFCQGGVNHGQRYECSEPCDNGEYFNAFMCDCFPEGQPCDSVAVTVESHISTMRDFADLTTFLFVAGAKPGAPARVYEGKVSVWIDNAWVDISPEPFAIGDRWEGRKIVDVIHKAKVAAVCSDSYSEV